MATINPILKQKVQTISDYSGHVLETEEISELGLIIDDLNAPLDERILAAKVMRNVAENRLLRAQRQVKHFSNLYNALVHTNALQRAEASLVNEGTTKLANVEGAEKFLEELLERIKAKK